MTICACAMPCSSCRRLRRSGKLAKSRPRGKAFKQAITTVRSLIVPPGDVLGDILGGDLGRADGRGICDHSSVHGRAGPARIGPAGVLMKVLDQKVDEAADLRRKMVAMRVDRIDVVLGLQELG